MDNTLEKLLESYGLDATQPIDLGKTMGKEAADWRDTLRGSLPLLPLGEDNDAQFKIQRELGKGGMGVVHLAHQSALGREVAIKTVLGDSPSRDAENALLQEARVMGLVEHPSVVPVHAIGQDAKGRPIIVMKRIQGTTWDAYFDGRAMTPSEDPQTWHLQIFIQVCNALSFAHSRQILHRDLKPENVMIGAFGEVYVLDWGLAVSMDPDNVRLPMASQAHGVVGTPLYMAPEMTTGDPDSLGVHTDVFLLGGLLYTIVTGGSAPNRGKNLFEVLSFAYTAQPRVYASIAPDELRNICERAMAHHPPSRYASAEELKSAVESYLAHRSSHVMVHKAATRVKSMHAEIANRGEHVEAIFAEARFAYMSALEIWRENIEAQSQLDACLRTMVEYRLDRDDVVGARALANELSQEDAALFARIAARSAELAASEARFKKMVYDYDESVGIGSRRSIVALMAAIFAATPFIMRKIAEYPVPDALQFITTDTVLLVSNAMGLAFFPALLGLLVYTFRRFGDHKTSRIFAFGLMWMYVVAMGARTSTLWGGTSIAMAAAAETAIFASGLMMLALAIDRRFGNTAFWFAVTSVVLAAVNNYAIEIYSAGSVAACLGFIRGGTGLTPPWLREKTGDA